MRRIFTVILLMLTAILNAQNNQHLKKAVCYYCSGDKVVRDYINCTNCLDWSAEYRRKVGCTVCKDNRRVLGPLHKCQICKGNGFIYKLNISSKLEFVTSNIYKSWDNEAKNYWDSFNFSVVDVSHITYQSNWLKYDFFDNGNFSLTKEGKTYNGTWEKADVLGLKLLAKFENGIYYNFTSKITKGWDIDNYRTDSYRMELERDKLNQERINEQSSIKVKFSCIINSSVFKNNNYSYSKTNEGQLYVKYLKSDSIFTFYDDFSFKFKCDGEDIIGNWQCDNNEFIAKADTRIKYQSRLQTWDEEDIPMKEKIENAKNGALANVTIRQSEKKSLIDYYQNQRQKNIDKTVSELIGDNKNISNYQLVKIDKNNYTYEEYKISFKNNGPKASFSIFKEKSLLYSEPESFSAIEIQLEIAKKYIYNNFLKK